MDCKRCEKPKAGELCEDCHAELGFYKNMLHFYGMVKPNLPKPQGIVRGELYEPFYISNRPLRTHTALVALLAAGAIFFDELGCGT